MSQSDHSVDQKTSNQPLASGHLTWSGLDGTTAQPPPGLITTKLHVLLVLNNLPKDSVYVLTRCRCEEPTVQCREMTQSQTHFHPNNISSPHFPSSRSQSHRNPALPALAFLKSFARMLRPSRTGGAQPTLGTPHLNLHRPM
jgi:hypothetical protein